MKFTKDDILWYIDDARWKFAGTNITAAAAIDIIYAAIEQSEDVLYQQGYDKAKEDIIRLLEIGYLTQNWNIDEESDKMFIVWRSTADEEGKSELCRSPYYKAETLEEARRCCEKANKENTNMWVTYYVTKERRAIDKLEKS